MAPEIEVIHDAIVHLKAQGHTAIKVASVARIAFAMLEERCGPPVSFAQFRRLVDRVSLDLWAVEAEVQEFLARPLPCTNRAPFDGAPAATVRRTAHRT